MADLINFGSLTMDLALFLEACVRGKLNVLVSGGTGTGKTTTLNVLSSFIPERERIVTIEDAAELQLQQPHVVRLESRPPNSEGRGEVRIRDLVRNALRMRPDRIVVGEVRGGEALDMLQAMNTGHAGSITTVHANTARDALARLETMVLMAGFDLPVRAIREQIASAINVIVQLERASDGTRRVVSVEEVQGLEGDIILLQQLFRFVPRMSADGRQVGEIEGGRPRGRSSSTPWCTAASTCPASVFQAPVRPREVRPRTRAVPSVAELIARSGGPVTGTAGDRPHRGAGRRRRAGPGGRCRSCSGPRSATTIWPPSSSCPSGSGTSPSRPSPSPGRRCSSAASRWPPKASSTSTSWPGSPAELERARLPLRPGEFVLAAAGGGVGARRS